MTVKSRQTWLFSFLFWLVGLSSWITITGLFNELALMSNDLVEGYEIWSIITLIIQIANIGPLIYSLMPRKIKTRKFVLIVAYFIFTLSCLSMVIMSLFWDHSMYIFGDNYSLVLYLTVFGTSTSDCMTSIIFWVFVSYFPTQYMAVLSAGESSSGIISAILIYIQQLNRADNDPRFSVEIYLLLLALTLPISAMAFTFLTRYLKKGYFDAADDWIANNNNETTQKSHDTSSLQHSLNTDEFSNILNNRATSQSQSQMQSQSQFERETEMVSSLSFNTKNTHNTQYSSMKAAATDPLIRDDILTQLNSSTDNYPKSTITLNTNQMDIITKHTGSNNNANILESNVSTTISENIAGIVLKNVSRGYWSLIIMIGVLSGIQNGMMPAISSYSLLPYGNTTYVFSYTISNIITPFVSLLPAYLPKILINKKFIIISSVGWLSTSIYVLTIAIQSPTPFGVNKSSDDNDDDNSNDVKLFFSVLIVIISVLGTSFLTICKTCMYLLIKKSFMKKSSFLDAQTLEKSLSKMMEIIGIAIQTGSFCGALIFFLLINVGDFFHQ